MMKVSLSLIAFMVVFSSCGYFNDPGSDLIVNIDTEFEIVIKENLTENGRGLLFNITSLDELQCEDTALEVSKISSNSEINIIINEITMPNQCGSLRSFPAGVAEFQVVSGDYLFGFQVQEQQAQKGSMQVTPDSYSLNLQNAKGLLIEKPLVYKIPANFVWGYYKAKSTSEERILEEFLLKNDLIVRPFNYLNQGNYSYFDIDADGYVIPEDLPSEGIVKALAFDLIQLEDLKEIVSNFKAANPDILLILNGSDGSLL